MEPSPNSPGNHVSLFLPFCAANLRERETNRRYALASSCREKDGASIGNGRSDEGRRENERIRNYREERGRVSRSVRLFARLFFLSPPRSTILRHSRRGLITACHCCHGNFRSVKNSSALTPIVRLKFHGERVCVVRPSWNDWANICVLRHDVSLPVKCVQDATMANDDL